jgi:hypothetical protein
MILRASVRLRPAVVLRDSGIEDVWFLLAHSLCGSSTKIQRERVYLTRCCIFFWFLHVTLLLVTIQYRKSRLYVEATNDWIHMGIIHYYRVMIKPRIW